jgi:hypothetical protein
LGGERIDAPAMVDDFDKDVGLKEGDEVLLELQVLRPSSVRHHPSYHHNPCNIMADTGSLIAGDEVGLYAFSVQEKAISVCVCFGACQISRGEAPDSISASSQ